MRWVAGTALCALLVPTAAFAQNAPVPIPARPETLESGSPELPQVVPYDDAKRLLRRQRARPAAPPVPSAAAAPASAGRQVIPVDAPPAESTAPRFLFRDATTRPTPRTRSPAEREATVEAIRRGLAPPIAEP